MRKCIETFISRIFFRQYSFSVASTPFAILTSRNTPQHLTLPHTTPQLVGYKSLSQSSHLSANSKVVTKRPYKCQICEKSFSRPSYLAAHSNLHTGEKPYKCQHCEKSFAMSTTLTRHMRIHTGDKPHEFQLCEKNIFQTRQSC